MGVGNDSKLACVLFQYFQQFEPEEKQFPSLLRQNCSKAIQSLYSLPVLHMWLRFHKVLATARLQELQKSDEKSHIKSLNLSQAVSARLPPTKI